MTAEAIENEAERPPADQVEVYSRKVRKIQEEIDVLVAEKRKLLAGVRLDAQKDWTPEEKDAYNKSRNVAAQTNDLILSMQSYKELIDGLNGKVKSEPKVFTVKGYYGPTTLRFTWIGRPVSCQVDRDKSQELSIEEVQDWYTHRGWPRNGLMMTRDFRNKPKGIFRMES